MSGFKLREYQEDIINQTINSDVDTLIQVPTGGGKTVISRYIAHQLSFFQNKRILFVAPKIILMEQTLKEFEKINPQVVYKTEKYNPYHSVLVSTIQTASRRDKIYPDVIIVDEVHYGYDGIMLKRLRENHPNARIIGLSATPYDSSGVLLEGFDLILDKYDMQYMINNEYLVNLKPYILTKKELISDLEKIKIIRGDYDIAQLHDVMCKNSTISEIIETTKEYIEKSKKTIVFAVDINHAELLTKAYNEKGFKACALHSKTKKENNEADEISEEIEKFRRGETKVLVSVLMLTTGFDVPDTDCAIIARPTRSQNLYKQMVGRVLRLAENKTHAVLLDCGNVIKNLGMPLAPIREIQGNEIVNKHKCGNCKSERLQLIKKEDGLYWKCKDCSEIKKVEEGGYTCESCCLVSSHEGVFSVEEDKVFLDCECGHKTLISEYIGEEEFVEVDNKVVLDKEHWIYELWDWALSFDILEIFFSEEVIAKNILTLNADELAKEMEYLLKLKEVMLCEVNTIPLALFKLTNLRILKIDSTNIKAFPNGISDLTYLEELEISSNKISVIREIFRLNKLRKLEIIFNSKEEFPKGISNLINLEELVIYNFFSIDLFKLKKLKKLTISECNIKMLPIEIGELIYLESLDLCCTNLVHIPKDIGKLFHLKSLNLSFNNLQGIPLQLKQLINLKKLNINSNKLSNFTINLEELINLKELNIGNNNLNSIPTSLYKLNSLENLSITGLNISKIPLELINLPKLKVLYVRTNKNLDEELQLKSKILLEKGLKIIQIPK